MGTVVTEVSDGFAKEKGVCPGLYILQVGDHDARNMSRDKFHESVIEAMKLVQSDDLATVEITFGREIGWTKGTYVGKGRSMKNQKRYYCILEQRGERFSAIRYPDEIHRDLRVLNYFNDQPPAVNIKAAMAADMLGDVDLGDMAGDMLDAVGGDLGDVVPIKFEYDAQKPIKFEYNYDGNTCGETAPSVPLATAADLIALRNSVRPPVPSAPLLALEAEVVAQTNTDVNEAGNWVLTYKEYKRRDDLNRSHEDECTICMERYEDLEREGTKCVVTACKHIFCETCYDGLANTCPMCRKPIQHLAELEEPATELEEPAAEEPRESVGDHEVLPESESEESESEESEDQDEVPEGILGKMGYWFFYSKPFKNW